MNQLVIGGTLTLIQSTLQWLMLRGKGDQASAWEILQSTDLSAFGFDDSTMDTINLARAGLGWLNRRGVPVNETVDLIKLAMSENRDITDDELEALFDKADVEFDETRKMIAELKAKEDAKAATTAKATAAKKSTSSKK